MANNQTPLQLTISSSSVFLPNNGASLSASCNFHRTLYVVNQHNEKQYNTILPQPQSVKQCQTFKMSLLVKIPEKNNTTDDGNSQ
jgi:hypothetical protein